jgi:hypothetical protein
VYDETPVKLRLRARSSVEASSKLQPPGGEKALAKVLQTRFSVGILVQRKQTHRQTFWQGAVPTVLQALERTRGEDLCAAQAAIIASLPDWDSVAQLCDVSIDLSTADRYLANNKAERGLQDLRDFDVPLHFDCEVHKVSTATFSQPQRGCCSLWRKIRLA